MRLLVVRHARAVPGDTPGISDAERPLTGDGERRFHSVARTITRLEPGPDVLLTSPLLRARQTAAILAATWGAVPVTVEPALASGSVERIRGALESQRELGAVALVGHEPTVSGLVSELLG